MNVSLRALSFRLGFRKEELIEVAARVGDSYRPFQKVRGTKTRTIDNPVGTLKKIQRRINLHILRPIDLPPHLHGGVRKRSPMTNAIQHLSRRYIVKIDVKDFFPSITPEHVRQVWRNQGFGRRVANLLTALTTYEGHLPQGAPTSTTLANLVLLGEDARALKQLLPAGLRFTRFVDDLTISGEHPQELIQAVIKILRGSGFQTRHQKLEIQNRRGQQTCTGYTVNSARGPSRPKQYRERVRAEIHQLRHLNGDAERMAHTLRSLRGKVENIRRTNPGSARRLDLLLKRVTSRVA